MSALNIVIMIKEIKKLFLNIEDEKPFKSYDFFSFLKYDRHRNFLRYIDQEKFWKNCCYEDYCYKIYRRYEKSVSFDRLMFIQLCKKQKIDTTVFEEYYLEYKRKLIKHITSRFITINKENKREFNPKMFPLPKGKNYNYSLNTLNIAKAIDICPYELFKFFSTKLQYKVEFVSLDFTNKYSFKEKIPYYHFDSKYSKQRNEILQVLIFLKEEYKLTELNKTLLEIYYEAIKEMLYKQMAIEHKKKFAAEKKQKRKEKGNLIKHTSKQMKLLYRKAAKMFHPDKNPKDLETFKKVSQYYRENNYSDLLKLVESK